jgi:hypothetical protein
MKKFICILTCTGFMQLYSQQDTFRTYNGFQMYPKDTIFSLNIFINIVYDVYSQCDPLDGQLTPFWPAGPANTVNQGLPTYLADYIDREYNPNNIHGTLTKHWAEASFKKFILLGDFVVVNLAQSTMTPGDSGSFDRDNMIDSVISLINQNGGLQTIYGHDTLSQYDFAHVAGSLFLPKTRSIDQKVDLIQFFTRNTTDRYGGVEGGGYGGANFHIPLHFIDGHDALCNYSCIQCIGKQDLSYPMTSPTEIHELCHHLIDGSDAGHMGGGSPPNMGDMVTLQFNNGGWSLFGAAGSALISCNGFERWRLGWHNPEDTVFEISAFQQNGNFQNSDIEKSDGAKTFYLRDFITYGDAIRIKIPYLDDGALNQYIWLENHQLKINTGKEDYPARIDAPCKDQGMPGIYAYYEVGKDIRESLNSLDLHPSLVDHLVPICADGRWDIRQLSQTDDACVFGDPGGTKIQEYYQPNPFCGYNDNQNHYFNSIAGNELNFNDRVQALIKKKDMLITNRLQQMGDNYDPFRGSHTSYTISTNPVPTNIITYHHSYDAVGQINMSTHWIDNRKIHLSGLGIEMYDQNDGRYKVDVRWDNYWVNNNVRWTGDIVLHERLDLNTGVKVTLDQNQTPDKHIRDAVTGLFTGPTYFTCLENSEYQMYNNSNTELNSLSSFITELNSTVKIDNNSILKVKQGTTLLLRQGSNLIVSGAGKVEVETGGCLCIENDANITLQDATSQIHLQADITSGVNTSVLTGNYDCRYNLISTPVTGSGKILADVNAQDVYIQNETVANTRNYNCRDLYLGEKVTSTKSFGSVVLLSGSSLYVNASRDILIDNGFTAALGSTLELW